MKAITRRLSRLENRCVALEPGEPSAAEQIRESRRRRFEREGRPFVDTLEEDLAGMPRGLKLGEMIRWHRSRHRTNEHAS